jgi:hypothetical protein
MYTIPYDNTNQSSSDTYKNNTQTYSERQNIENKQDYNSDNDSDILVVDNVSDLQYNYLYPSDSEYYFNHYDIDIDSIYFNATHMNRDYYARDWKCFHCGDKGHRAGWFCPLVRKNQPQTGRGAQAYAEYQKKYAKEIRPYKIEEILKTEKEFWEKKGKDIQQMVHNYVKQSLSNNNNTNKSNDNNDSSRHNNINNNNMNTNRGINLLDKIKANRDKIKNKRRDVTDRS